MYFPLASKDLHPAACSFFFIPLCVPRRLSIKFNGSGAVGAGGRHVCNWAALRCPELVSPYALLSYCPKWRTHPQSPTRGQPQLRQQFNQFIAVPANPWLKAFANILFYFSPPLYSLRFRLLSCLFVDPLGFMFIVDIGSKLPLLLVNFFLLIESTVQEIKRLLLSRPPVSQYFSFL